MFRPYKFKVVVPDATGGAATPALAIRFNAIGPIEAVVGHKGEEKTLKLFGNGGDAFLIESLGQFDRDGAELYLGDVLDHETDEGKLERGKIYWDGNSCCYAFRIGRSDGTLPLTLSTLRKMRKVGNAFESKAIDTDGYTDEEVDEMKRRLFDDQNASADANAA